jgi:hypothetical protein
MVAIAFAATCRLFVCLLSILCLLFALYKGCSARLSSVLLLIAMHAWERLSTGGSDVAGGQSATLGGLHVEATSADGLAGLKLSSFQDNLNGGPIGDDESVVGYTITGLRGKLTRQRPSWLSCPWEPPPRHHRHRPSW